MEVNPQANKRIVRRLGIREGESITIGESSVTVKINGKRRSRGRRVVLVIESPPSIPVTPKNRQSALPADRPQDQSEERVISQPV